MNTRNKSIELLRVIAMLLIVIGHYCYHGIKSSDLHSGFPVNTIGGIIEYSCMEILYIIACISVNCYVMITGYFLSDRTVFRWKGIIGVWIQTVFYGLIIWGGVFVWKQQFSLQDIRNALLPIYSGSYWFIPKYIALLLIAPFLSTLILHLTKKQYQILLIICGILSFQFLYGQRFAGTMSLNWFIFLFFVAGYIKRYDVPSFIKEKIPIIFWGLVICFFVAVTAFNVYKLKVSNIPFHLRSSANDGVMFFLSTAVFLFFVGKDTIHNKIASAISNLAPYTLGVYLIHANPHLNRCGFWDYVIPESFNIPIVVHCILSCTLIFLLCIFIDYIRARLFKMINVDRFVENVTKKLPREL